MCPLVARKAWLLVGIVLLTVAAPLCAGESEAGRELRQRLSHTVNFQGYDDTRLTLNDAMENLSKRYNLTFDINEKAFEEEGVKQVGQANIIDPMPIPPMRTATLATVVRKVLQKAPSESGATYLIRGDAIEITTMEAIRKEFFAERPRMPGPLPPLVSGTFEKVPFEAALKELNQYGNIVLDARAAKDVQVQVSADIVNVPLDTTVRMFADMAGLTVVAMDNALYVTSKDNARVLLKEREQLRCQREREKKEKASEGKDKGKKPKHDPTKADAASGKKNS